MAIPAHARQPGDSEKAANDRLSLTDEGRVLSRLKTPWANGTTHLLYEPLDFLAKLSALIPRPQNNLIQYPWRARGTLEATCASGGLQTKP